MCHIVLVGFKSTGKSTIGRELANRLCKNFIDLDENIEHLFELEHRSKLSCRQIMLALGEIGFRDLENAALRSIICTSPAVVALGGGAAISLSNQALIKGNFVIHITAPKDIVFNRIMLDGIPAFLPHNENVLEAFSNLWNERKNVYYAISHYSVENRLINDAVAQIEFLYGQYW